MTIRLEDLDNFMSRFRKKGYYEITNQMLTMEIGKEFGVTDYTQENIRKYLVRFGFMQPMGKSWRIMGMEVEKPKESKEEIESDLEKYDEIIKDGGGEDA